MSVNAVSNISFFHESNQGLSVRGGKKIFVFGRQQSRLCARRDRESLRLFSEGVFNPLLLLLLLLSAQSLSRGAAAERSSVEVILRRGLPSPTLRPSPGHADVMLLAFVQHYSRGPGNVDCSPGATFHAYYRPTPPP